MRLGVVSDTHGLVRPAALDALRGCDAIVHAGDVGGEPVLAAFAALAPLTVVRGNNDRGDWARALPERAVVAFGEHRLLVLHDRHELDVDPRAAGYAAVIAGHSHRPDVRWEDGVLHLDPGSAGPRRFRLPIAVAVVDLVDGRLVPTILTLDQPAAR